MPFGTLADVDLLIRFGVNNVTILSNHYLVESHKGCICMFWLRVYLQSIGRLLSADGDQQLPLSVDLKRGLCLSFANHLCLLFLPAISHLHPNGANADRREATEALESG